MSGYVGYFIFKSLYHINYDANIKPSDCFAYIGYIGLTGDVKWANNFLAFEIPYPIGTI